MQLYNQPSINVTVPTVVLWGVGFYLLSQKHEGWVSGARTSCLCYCVDMSLSTGQ